MKKTWTVKFNSLKTLALLTAGGLATQLANGQCLPPPPGLVAWWPGDGNAGDIIGMNNGSILGGVSFVPGKVAQAFSFDGSSGYIAVGNTATMDFETEDFSIAGWVWFNSLSDDQVIIQKVLGSYPNERGYVLEFNYPNALRFMVHDTSANKNDLYVSTSVIPDRWYHVAAVRSGNTNSLFLDGDLIGWQTAGNNINTGQGGIAQIGKRSPNGIPGFPRYFMGLLDELSLFDRTLSPQEIEALNASGSAGMCGKLRILTQPQSQIGYWGRDVSFSVSATNFSTASLSYQWLKDATPIPDATNAVLTLTNLQSTNAGTYTVVVTDSNGYTVTSDPANLTVNPAGVAIALYAGVTIDGVVGQTYGVQSTMDLNNTNSWVGRANITLTTPAYLWYDSQPATQPQTYYRVLPGPISIP